MDSERPLIEFAEERQRSDDEIRREIHSRCVTVERACRHVGFRANSVYEHVAVLIAKAAGWNRLARTAEDIAADADVNCSARHARRAIIELTQEGVITSCELPPPARKTRGRKPVLWGLQLCRDTVAELVADSSRYEAECRGDLAATELRTSPRHHADKSAASCGQTADTMAASRVQVEKHTALYPYSQIPSPSSRPIEKTETATARDFQEFETAVDAVRDAGVERVRSLIRLAKSQDMTPAELIDAAYCVKHTPKLGGGALLDFVRNGDWPCSGVKPADVLRDERRQRAGEIRREVAENAPDGTPETAIKCVMVKKLRAAGLGEFVDAIEASTFERLTESVK